jgi:hypothetical protein
LSIEVLLTRDGDEGYAMTVATDSFNWYKSHAIRARRSFKAAEMALLVGAACVPTSAVLWPENATVPAVLGGLVVILAGLRSIFHWQENYLRFSSAREAVEAERRLYRTSAPPYDNPASRDQVLVAAVSRIEQEEMRGWIEVAQERPEV